MLTLRHAACRASSVAEGLCLARENHEPRCSATVRFCRVTSAPLRLLLSALASAASPSMSELTCAGGSGEVPLDRTIPDLLGVVQALQIEQI